MNAVTAHEIREGLRQALMAATANLYRVFTAPDRGEDHEANFVRGIGKHATDYERMNALVAELIEEE
jgi:hypothetical protein